MRKKGAVAELRSATAPYSFYLQNKYIAPWQGASSYTVNDEKVKVGVVGRPYWQQLAFLWVKFVEKAKSAKKIVHNEHTTQLFL